jgi:hypothetical protein
LCRNKTHRCATGTLIQAICNPMCRIRETREKATYCAAAHPRICTDEWLSAHRCHTVPEQGKQSTGGQWGWTEGAVWCSSSHRVARADLLRGTSTQPKTLAAAHVLGQEGSGDHYHDSAHTEENSTGDDGAVGHRHEGCCTQP